MRLIKVSGMMPAGLRSLIAILWCCVACKTEPQEPVCRVADEIYAVGENDSYGYRCPGCGCECGVDNDGQVRWQCTDCACGDTDPSSTDTNTETDTKAPTCEKDGTEYPVGDGYSHGCEGCGCDCDLVNGEATWMCTDCGCPEPPDTDTGSDTDASK